MFLNDFRPQSIIDLSIGHIMLRTVQFYNQFGGMAIKINNIILDNTLFIYFNRILTKKIIP